MDDLILSLVGPEWSPEYTNALIQLIATMLPFRDKLVNNTPFTAEEAERVLNANWTVYLYAMTEGDMRQAQESNAFIEIVVDRLRKREYTVTFTDKYTVTAKGEQA